MGKTMSLLPDFNWRYATKRYDQSKKVSAEILDEVLEAIRMAPTSHGYQPFDVIVVSNAEVREKLRAASYNQPQITESSHVLVFAAWDTFSAEKLNQVFDAMAEARGASDKLEEQRASAIASYAGQPAEQQHQHAARQAFIGLGFGLAAAAHLRVDSSPMGGFNGAAYDEILGLKAKGLRSVVVMALGYRDEANDWLVKQAKVRRPIDKMVHWVK
jgi:nitroreductase/dihydropteridine reductase